MTTGLPSVAAVFGTGLTGVVVATGMVLLGVNPLLSVLAAALLTLDVLYYTRRTRVEQAAAWQELDQRRYPLGRTDSVSERRR